jgi:hypothetical protein
MSENDLVEVAVRVFCSDRISFPYLHGQPDRHFDVISGSLNCDVMLCRSQRRHRATARMTLTSKAAEQTGDVIYVTTYGYAKEFFTIFSILG